MIFVQLDRDTTKITPYWHGVYDGHERYTNWSPIDIQNVDAPKVLFFI